MPQLKIVVKPAHERSRWFRDLVAAMLFAESARIRQGPSLVGCVVVDIYDGYVPHAKASYSHEGKGVYKWTWSRA